MNTRPGVYTIPSLGLALYFKDRPTEAMKANAQREKETTRG